MARRYFWQAVWVAQVLWLLAAPAGLSAAETASEIAKKVLPSVVLLMMEDDAGRALSVGSGFVVREGVIATNMHVIKRASRGYAKLPGYKTKYDIAGTLATDSARDLVLLSVKNMKAPPLKIGDSSKAVVGDEVYAAGNPQGLEGTFSSGIVSGVRKVGEGRLLQITAPISAGSSGGPVVNSGGEVIGVSVATFEEGQNLNFAIPSAYLLPMISGTTKLTPLSPVIAPDEEVAQANGNIKIDDKWIRLPEFDLTRPSSQTQPYLPEKQKVEAAWFRASKTGNHYGCYIFIDSPDVPSVWRNLKTWEETLPALQVGEFGKIFKCYTVQIRGPEDMIVRVGLSGLGRWRVGVPDPLWNRLVRLHGFSTEGLTDGMKNVLDDAIAIIGTWTYITADNTNRTILLAVPLERVKREAGCELIQEPSEPRICPFCKGSGRLIERSLISGTIVSVTRPCEHCKGTGKIAP
ncbi:MAG: trypsin-like peptidase domain-containing protein [Phycisphaerae bacterium]